MKDLYIPLSELYHLTEEEIGQLLGSGRQTVFRNRVGWASTYLNKAGLVNKPQRGCIQITDEGLSVLKDNPVKIDMKYLSKYESFQEFSGMKEDISNTASDTSNADDASSPQDLTPDDKLSDAFKDINQALDDTNYELSELMAETETQNFTRGGMMFYLTTKTRASAVAGIKEELFDALRAQGYGSLVTETVNANSLSSFVKEQMEANGEALPDWLEGLVNVFDKTQVALKKATK
jgi:restriction endonuclease Mrr